MLLSLESPSIRSLLLSINNMAALLLNTIYADRVIYYPLISYTR